MTRGIADHQSTKARVTDEYVRAEPKNEEVDTELSGGSDSHFQIIGRCGIVEVVGWTTDLECGVLSKRLIPFEPLRVETVGQFPVYVGAHFHSI